MLLLAVVERSFYGLQNWWLSVWSNSNAATVVSCTFALLQILPVHCQHVVSGLLFTVRWCVPTNLVICRLPYLLRSMEVKRDSHLLGHG